MHQRRLPQKAAAQKMSRQAASEKLQLVVALLPRTASARTSALRSKFLLPNKGCGMRMNHGFDMARRSHGVAHSLWPLGNQALSCVLALIHRSMTCDRFIILSLCVNLFFLFHVLSYRLKRGAAAGGTWHFM